jgi:hypothetical protein
MTANYIAQVVENLYNKIDIDKMSAGFDQLKKYDSTGRISDEWANRSITEKSYFRWCQAIAFLEDYCRMHYTTFEETELVYKWAKSVCKQRTRDFNQWRELGGYSTFEQYLKTKIYA